MWTALPRHTALYTLPALPSYPAGDHNHNAKSKSGDCGIEKFAIKHASGRNIYNLHLHKNIFSSIILDFALQ